MNRHLPSPFVDRLFQSFVFVAWYVVGIAVCAPATHRIKRQEKF